MSVPLFRVEDTMASRRSFHLKLSSIMEAMARSALRHVCDLVDEEVSELRLGLTRLTASNSALVEKVKCLECELQTARSELSVSASPSIEGVFGKDWCMDLWKGGEERSPPPRPSEEFVLPEQMSASQIKEEMEHVEDAAGSCQHETLGTEEHEESPAEEPEPLAVCLQSTSSRSADQDEEQVLCAGGIEEPTTGLMSVADTERAFSIYTIPKEDDYDKDEAVPFVEESQQAAMLEAACGTRHVKQDTVPSNNFENGTAQDSLEDFNMLNVETPPDPSKEKFQCKLCSITFFHKRTLTQHMKYHKSLSCKICAQQFSQKSKLKSHRCSDVISTQRFGKSCPLCGKIFQNASALRLHSVVHTGEKSHRCGICGKGFTQKGNLNCHLRLHTGEKPFRCVKCGKTFTQKVHLNYHLIYYGHGEIL